MDNGVWHARGLDQLFLGKLGAEVAAFLQPLGTDDGERNMMFDASRLFGGQQGATGGFEKVHDGLVFEGRRIGEVDDNLRPGQRLCKPLSGDRVDARVGRRGDHVMVAAPQAFDCL